MSILYFTADEKRLFDTLPNDVKKGWEGSVEIETIDAYETVAELQGRMAHTSYDKYPAAKALADKARRAVERGEGLREISFLDLPSEALPVFFYSIGACGVSAMIELSLQDAEKLRMSGMEGVEALSRIRHHLLQQNSSAHS